ncbi:hypothetical protein CDEN61S_00458 [Castellaniella denitrificans]
MADMSLGIHCLLEDDPGRALELARALDEINRERRARETVMRDEARRTWTRTPRPAPPASASGSPAGTRA